MRHVALLALLLTGGCRHTFEERPDASPTNCDLVAQTSDLTSLRSYVFEPHCNYSGCHSNSSTEDLQLEETAHAELVNVMSALDPNYRLVVPGQPKQSYLLYMLKKIPPLEMDPPITTYTEPPDSEFMPKDFSICQEKIDAVERWIVAGALDN